MKKYYQNQAQILFYVFVVILILIIAYIMWPITLWTGQIINNKIQDYQTHSRLEMIPENLKEKVFIQKNILDKISLYRKSGLQNQKGAYIFNQIQNDANAHKVQILDWVAYEEIKGKNGTEYPFSLRVEGESKDLFKWVNYMENTPLWIQVKSLKAESFGLNEAEISLELELSAFVYKDTL